MFSNKAITTPTKLHILIVSLSMSSWRSITVKLPHRPFRMDFSLKLEKEEDRGIRAL